MLLQRTLIKFYEYYFAGKQNLGSLRYWITNAIFGDPVKVTVVRAIEGRKVVLYASFESRPNPLLDAQLTELVRAGFETVFVSNLPLSTEFHDWLKTRVSVVITRPNVARDFGAYKCGYQYLVKTGLIDKVEQILFTNDTIFFPLFDPQRFWLELNTRDEDVIGPYESFGPAHHVQSFFMLCRNGVHKQQFFKDYWENYIEWNSRRYTIAHGEIGFSGMLKANKVNFGALINQERCRELVQEFKLEGGHATTFAGVRVPTSVSYVPSAEGTNLSRIKAEQQLFHLLETENPSHALSIFSIVYARLPLLKKDVVYRGTVMLGDIVSMHSQAQVTLPLQDMLELFKRKRLPSERTFWDKMRDKSGAT